MAHRLADAISPYLRSHAGNPVDWFAWGEEAFAEARSRDVPVLVSIGYSTCHWCHVMARESFSDPVLAGLLNDRFVAIKVDREENPEVDASYLAAASAFTQNLGWPLNVFVTPAGQAFFAGTYFPPNPLPGRASFRQVLEAVSEAWRDRREEVETSAARVVEAVAAAAESSTSIGEDADASALDAAVQLLERFEDTRFGGFGGAPKFPVAPVLGFLLARSVGVELGLRTLRRISESPLRDPVDGGFFRYATRRDWDEPHYERMLYDNALLLDACTQAWKSDREAREWASFTAAGIAGFLTGVLQLPSGGFASGQDSESVIDGARVEGEYYLRDADQRASLTPPALDEKVLTGWNGLAIAALARAGFAFGRAEWIEAARGAADYLLAAHVESDGRLVRTSLGGRISRAPATLEDYGAFAGALVELALATGEVRYANAAREIVTATMAADPGPEPFVVPGGGDPVLAQQGLGMRADPSEGAYPSGLTVTAAAAEAFFLLTADRRFDLAAREAMRLVADRAVENPMAFGGALALMARLDAEPVQLVVVVPDADADTDAKAGALPTAAHLPRSSAQPLVEVARGIAAAVTAVVTAAQAAEFTASGFELFAGRGCLEGQATAYLCRHFVCALPTTSPDTLAALA